MTSGQISSGLDLTYAPSTITTQKPTEGELVYCSKLYSNATTTTADTAPTPTNSSSQATNFPNTSQDVDELETQQHVQHQPATIADNVPNAMFDENTFVNPFATPSTSDAESSSSQYVDPSNMHTSDKESTAIRGECAMYALTLSIVEPKNVNEASMTSTLHGLKSCKTSFLQVKKHDVWVLGGYRQEKDIDFEESLILCRMGSYRIFLDMAATSVHCVSIMDVKLDFLA
ncbi:hypothetical protein Tco_1343949 [Tanacetum coccineum]